MVVPITGQLAAMVGDGGSGERWESGGGCFSCFFLVLWLEMSSAAREVGRKQQERGVGGGLREPAWGVFSWPPAGSKGQARLLPAPCSL